MPFRRPKRESGSDVVARWLINNPDATHRMVEDHFEVDNPDANPPRIYPNGKMFLVDGKMIRITLGHVRGGRRKLMSDPYKTATHVGASSAKAVVASDSLRAQSSERKAFDSNAKCRANAGKAGVGVTEDTRALTNGTPKPRPKRKRRKDAGYVKVEDSPLLSAKPPVAAPPPRQLTVAPDAQANDLSEVFIASMKAQIAAKNPPVDEGDEILNQATFDELVARHRSRNATRGV